ncbi:hypothetical protein ACO34A_09865 [Rhizobium sp. ACO-34A]|nr:hypothetical protein [Rhizobium sp. ACO-34A]ATN34111.1 hypothetical protein ACO34A_09865 [Rhizobium sp. ACO-34A]
MTMTSLICTVEPSEQAVDNATIYRHLASIIEDGQSAPDDASLISVYLAAATSRLHGPNGLLGRALLDSTWEAKFDRWPAEVRIPLPRCMEVMKVEYVPYGATDAVELASSAFLAYGLGTDTARIRPAAGLAWPLLADHPAAVVVTFRAGWTQDTLPATIKHALLEMVTTAYAHRESVGYSTASFGVLPYSASQALRDWVVWTA